jgi:hypothetical protein
VSLADLASQDDSKALVDAWLEQLPDGPEPGEAFSALSALVASGRHDQAVEILEMSLEEMERAGSHALPGLVMAAARVIDQSRVLRSFLLEQLRDEYLMFEPLEDFIRMTGLADPSTAIRQAWQKLEGLLGYREGEWVNHPAMGPGRIIRMTRSSATVDFETSRSHDMSLDALMKDTSPLRPDSVRILRRSDPGAFRNLVSRPDDLLERLLNEQGGRLDRQSLAGLVPQGEIPDLWKRIKEAARSADSVMETGDAITSLGGGDLEQRMRQILASREPLAERNRMLSALIKASPRPAVKASSEAVLGTMPPLRTVETGADFELRWILSGEPADPAFADGIDGLVEDTPARVLRAIGEINSPSCRRLYLAVALSSIPSSSRSELLGALNRVLWNRAIEILEETDRDWVTGYLSALAADRTDVEMHIRAIELHLAGRGMTGIPEGTSPVALALESLPRARADTQRRIIEVLLHSAQEALEAHFKQLDTRRLDALSTQLADIGAAQDSGLLLLALSELSLRKASAGRQLMFWERDSVFDARDAIVRRREALERLRSTDLPAAARAIAEAASHGDLSEN